MNILHHTFFKELKMQLKSLLLFIPFLSPIIFFMLIFTNNKKELYKNTTNYDVSIAPGQTLSSISGALNTINTGLEISPAGVYYSMEDNWGKTVGASPDLFSNLPSFGLVEDQPHDKILGIFDGVGIMGRSVTGIDSNTVTKIMDGKEEKLIDSEGKNISHWMTDNSGLMRFFNTIPGFQSWSEMHDYYLSNENTYRPFGDHTQWTIFPFLVLGTYGGIYGTIIKSPEYSKLLYKSYVTGTINKVNEIRGKNK